jgi:hypothetical protein
MYFLICIYFHTNLFAGIYENSYLQIMLFSTGVVGYAHVQGALNVYGENLHTRNIDTDNMSSAMQRNVRCSIRWLPNTGKDGDMM